MVLELGVILLLILINGVFAGAEIAVVGIQRARLVTLLDQGRRGARAVSVLRANPERFFATVQIVITVVGATAAAFGGATLAADLSPLLTPIAGAHAHRVAIALVIVIISYLSLVIGELVPKSLALRRAEPYALAIAPILLWLSSLARPLVWLFTTSSNLFLRLFGERTTFSETRVSPEELSHLVDEATESGAINREVGDIASRAIDFAELTAEHVMIPRTRMVSLPRNADVDTIRDVVLEHAHSRLPVHDGNPDAIVGYVLYKDLLPLAWQGQLVILEDLLREPLEVVQSTPASEVLRQMRERRSQLAIVIDERGGIAGMVTLDDLIEELIGEVFGEIHSDAPESIHPMADGSIVVDGDVPIRELNRRLEVELPEGDGFMTVGGLCMFLAGDVPHTGDLLNADDGTRLRILDASERAVQSVEVIPQTR